jgi:hypothetical protein
VSALAFPQTSTTRRVGDDERARILSAPGFGQHYTDFMARARWTAEGGWGQDEVVPFGPLQLSPATAVLHYGQEIFEGLKAFRHADGSVWTFRPEANAERMRRSARRLALPELPVEDFLDLPEGRGRGRRALGSRGDERGVPLPAPVHVRERGVPRREGGRERRLLRHRLPGRSLLPARRAAAGRVDHRRVRSCGRGRHRRREVRRQLRLLPAGQARGRRARRRRGALPRLRDAHEHRRALRDERRRDHRRTDACSPRR